MNSARTRFDTTWTRHRLMKAGIDALALNDEFLIVSPEALLARDENLRAAMSHRLRGKLATGDSV